MIEGRGILKDRAFAKETVENLKRDTEYMIAEAEIIAEAIGTEEDIGKHMDRLTKSDDYVIQSVSRLMSLAEGKRCSTIGKNEIFFDRKETYLELIDGDVYHFRMPPLKPVADANRFYRYNYHALMAEKLLKEYRYEKDSLILFEKAALVMVHDFADDVHVNRIPDYDNLRTKGIVDAMGYRLIRNDNLISTEVHSYGRRAEKDSFNLYVMSKNRFPEWLIESGLYDDK